MVSVKFLKWADLKDPEFSIIWQSSNLETQIQIKMVPMQN